MTTEVGHLKARVTYDEAFGVWDVFDEEHEWCCTLTRAEVEHMLNEAPHMPVVTYYSESNNDVYYFARSQFQ